MCYSVTKLQIQTTNDKQTRIPQQSSYIGALAQYNRKISSKLYLIKINNTIQKIYRAVHKSKFRHF